MLKQILSAIGVLSILIVVAIEGGFTNLYGRSWFAPPSKNSQQQLEAKVIEGMNTAAQMINQQGPTMIDKETRIDRASVGPGAMFTYHHTFINYTSRDLDQNWLQTKLQPQVKKNVCANEKMKPTLQYGGIYVYSYVGSDKVKIGSFTIDRNDCGFPPIQP
jgi:hypothetical protein